MATLTAFKFDTVTGAERMLRLLQEMQRQRLIIIQDRAIVVWQTNAKTPRTRRLAHLAGALGGAFWGLYFGLLLLVPLVGMAIGAGMGAVAGARTYAGIDDDFLKDARASVTPGTSALCLLTNGTVEDRVVDAIKKEGLHPQLVSSNLTTEQAAKMKEAFAEA